MNPVQVIAHPLVQHHLTRLRDRRTEPQAFRRVMNELTALMVYEATRSLPTRDCPIETPLEPMVGRQLESGVALIRHLQVLYLRRTLVDQAETGNTRISGRIPYTSVSGRKLES